MNARHTRWLMAALAAVPLLTASLVATTRPQARPLTKQARATFPKVFLTTDARTGLQIRTTENAPDDVSIEVADPSVAIRRHIADQKSITTLTTRDETVTMEVDSSRWAVILPTGRLEGQIAQRETLAPLAAALAGSRSADAALRLLSRLSLNPGSFSGHALLLTRALLQSLRGDQTGVAELVRWTTDRATHAGAVPAGLPTDGPLYCWNTYAIAAVQVNQDYRDCYDDCGSWHLACKLGCATVYDLRAEGAFAWWMKCTAIRA